MAASVALLGNMNNNHFALARYLRDRGFAADLFMFDRQPSHFHPSCDAYGDAHEGFVHQLPWGSVQRFPVTPGRTVRHALEGYGALVGCGAAPAYLARARRRLDVFVPVGGDLWTYAGESRGRAIRLPGYWPIIPFQRQGLRTCSVVHMAPTNDLYEGQMRRFRSGRPRWTDGLPMVYAPAYRRERLEAVVDGTDWAAAFQAVRDEADFLLFTAARHHWWQCPPSDPAAKGTDRLLRGLALFRQANPGVRVRLVTLEYGRDVGHSKALAAKLGLEDVVHWFPKMDRKELMVGLAKADVACAEFENSWVASGVLYEALVLEKPILAYRDDSLYDAQAKYPILNAREPQEIARRLQEAWADPGRARAIGKTGRAWYDEQVVERALDKYVTYFRNL